MFLIKSNKGKEEIYSYFLRIFLVMSGLFLIFSKEANYIFFQFLFIMNILLSEYYYHIKTPFKL